MSILSPTCASLEANLGGTWAPKWLCQIDGRAFFGSLGGNRSHRALQQSGPGHLRPAKAGHGRAWPAMAGHDSGGPTNIPSLFIKGQRHPKSVVDSGPKVGPGLNKKLISMRLFSRGFHCQMENNKAAPSAPPLWGSALRAPPLWVFVVFHLAVETRNKKPEGNRFFY